MDMPPANPAPAGAPAASGPATLAEALEREHREIDLGIEAFLAAHAAGGRDTGSLARAMEALRRHIFLEEEFLFGPLREAGLVAPVFVMLREHGEIWDTLGRLDLQLRADPASAVLSDTCRDLLARLARHNAKEEPILYPQVDAALRAVARTELESFLAAGRLPHGWTCGTAASAQR